MARKRNRTKQRKASPATENSTPRRRKKRGPNAASLMFIGLIVLIAAAIAIASALDGRDRPECPAGQVWSDAHNHCH